MAITHIRVPVTADTLAYLIKHNKPGETYGRTAARILETATAQNVPPCDREILTRRQWTPEEDAAVLDTSRTYKQIGADIGRSPNAVATRRSRLRNS